MKAMIQKRTKNAVYVAWENPCYFLTFSHVKPTIPLQSHFSMFPFSVNSKTPCTPDDMEIKHPRRILVLGAPDCDVSRVLKGRNALVIYPHTLEAYNS